MSAVIQVFWGMAVLAPGMLLGIVILWLTPQRRPTPQPNANAPQEPYCDWCGRAIKQQDGRWIAVKGEERGYDPAPCDANTDDGTHEPASSAPSSRSSTPNRNLLGPSEQSSLIPDNLWDIDQWIAATIRDSFQKIEAETATNPTSTAPPDAQVSRNVTSDKGDS